HCHCSPLSGTTRCFHWAHCDLLELVQLIRGERRQLERAERIRRPVEQWHRTDAADERFWSASGPAYFEPSTLDASTGTERPSRSLHPVQFFQRARRRLSARRHFSPRRSPDSQRIHASDAHAERSEASRLEQQLDTHGFAAIESATEGLRHRSYCDLP